jgi:hypothetical protein
LFLPNALSCVVAAQQVEEVSGSNMLARFNLLCSIHASACDALALLLSWLAAPKCDCFRVQGTATLLGLLGLPVVLLGKWAVFVWSLCSRLVGVRDRRAA